MDRRRGPTIRPAFCQGDPSNNKDADWTAQMRRLVCAFVVCMRISSGLEKLMPFDCLNINEFGAMQMNIY